MFLLFLNSFASQGEIEGYLFEPDGVTPVPGAFIVIYDPDGIAFSAPFFSKDAETDDNGYFYISNLSPGDYILDAYPVNYVQEDYKKYNTPFVSPDIVKIKLYPGKRVKINLQLAISPIQPKAKEYYDLSFKHYGNFHRTEDKSFLLKGIELIDKAIALDKSFLRAYYIKGLMLMWLEEHQNAILALSAGLEKSPKGDPYKLALFSLRGMIRQQIGDNKSYFDDYTRAIEIFKDQLINERYHPGVISHFSQLMFLMDNMNDGLIFLRELSEKYPKNRVLKERLKLYKEDMKSYKNITINDFMGESI